MSHPTPRDHRHCGHPCPRQEGCSLDRPLHVLDAHTPRNLDNQVEFLLGFALASPNHQIDFEDLVDIIVGQFSVGNGVLEKSSQFFVRQGVGLPNQTAEVGGSPLPIPALQVASFLLTCLGLREYGHT